MSFATKADLKTAVDDWLARADISGNADDRIKLAEGKLNRKLGAILTSTTLSSVANVRSIDVSTLSVAEPLELFLAETGLNEVPLTKLMDGQFAYQATASRPSYWAYLDDASDIVFECPTDAVYPFRFKFRQRFSLATDGATNWLLTNHPDLYLAAAIVWGGLYTGDQTKMAFYTSLLSEGIPEVKAYISRQNKGTLVLDPALASIGHSLTMFNINTG